MKNTKYFSKKSNNERWDIKAISESLFNFTD